MGEVKREGKGRRACEKETIRVRERRGSAQTLSKVSSGLTRPENGN